MINAPLHRYRATAYHERDHHHMLVLFIFFFNDTATTEIYTSIDTLFLHDALPISVYSVPSGPSVACSIPEATVSTRALPRSSAKTSLFGLVPVVSFLARASFFFLAVVSFVAVVT